MRELRINREVNRRQAAQANARPVHMPSHLAIHARFGSLAADYTALPEDTASQSFAQDGDGAFFFMLDWSSLDGSDPLQ
jgi:hypothetical protein